MLALQLFWAWCRKYWFLFLAVGGFILGYVIFRKSDVDLGKLIDGINADHQKDIESIKNKDKEIADGKAKIKEEEKQKLEELDKKYEDLQRTLDVEQKKRAEKIMKDTDGDPDELAKRLADLTGSKKLD